MLRFKCPSCQKRLKSPEARSGHELPCPSCGTRIVIPAIEIPKSEIPQSESCEQSVSDEDSGQSEEELQCNEKPHSIVQANPQFEPQTKTCPFCGETIQFAAKKCRFCGEFLDRQGRSNAAVQQPFPVIQKTGPQRPWVFTRDGCNTVSIFILGLIFIGFPMVCMGLLGPNSDSGVSNVTCEELFQVLVDDVDERLKANIFGKVTRKGDHLFVVLESDYFDKLDERTKRFALESIRDQWTKSACYGKKVTFTRWNGAIVTEL